MTCKPQKQTKKEMERDTKIKFMTAEQGNDTSIPPTYQNKRKVEPPEDEFFDQKRHSKHS